ncbi:MAG: 5-(carboxyamino)imidazole ribonucleotide synthase [Actinobacteria bacterium]|nr:5-(carboxyamino)imidazole ribonucleotide synthase [Actinomycetota bacterium]
MTRPTVGIVGGGQLARMTAPAAVNLDVHLRVMAASPDDCAAAAIPDVFYGDHDDLVDLLKFAEGCDVVTFDHEHVPPEHLLALQEAGVAVRPGPAALVHAQDKIIMRQALSSGGIPCPRWAEVADADDVALFAEAGEWPVVLKVSRGGYDGKGVWVLESRAEAEQVMAAEVLRPGARWLVEERVPFVRELSAQVARSPHGQAVAYPVVQSLQVDGICKEVVAPAPELDATRSAHAQRVALDVAALLGVEGMLAVEMFDTGSEVLVNELAMRPHNTGHWSIEGADTSQFENHLRAVLDLPLGSPTPRLPYAVMVNILGGQVADLHACYRHVMASDPGLKIHLYGKVVRPGRKVGHVTALGTDVDVLLERCRHAADFFEGTIDG